MLGTQLISQEKEVKVMALQITFDQRVESIVLDQ